MKYIASIILLATLTASAQVSTTCTTNGNITNCDSIDYGAQRQRDYEAGQQLGNAAGGLIAGLIARHQFNSLRNEQCRHNGAGSDWHIVDAYGTNYQGTCTDKQAAIKPQKSVAAKPFKGSYPECSRWTDAASAKECNALMVPDAPIVPACQSLATNERGTQPEAYRLCVAASDAPSKRVASR